MERTSRQQLWKSMGGDLSEKQAELANTYDMPWSPASSKRNDKGKEKAVIKTASVLTEDDLLKMAFEADTCDASSTPDTNDGSPVLGENPTSQPQPKVLKPTVDVTDKEAPKAVTQKTASRYALPLIGKYPLDTYGQVKQASAYFNEWQVRMTPEMRREYCVNMVKRAHELSIPVSGLAARYGSECYASPEQIKVAMDARRTVLHAGMDPLRGVASEDTDTEVLNKLAEAQPGLMPDNFAAALGAFDQATGLDEFYGGDVPDPYFSTFQKAAAVEVEQELETDPKDSILIGNEYLTRRELVSFSKNSTDQILKRFGEDFSTEFLKDPNTIFDSLPRDQKLVLMNMAQSHHAQGNSASKS